MAPTQVGKDVLRVRTKTEIRDRTTANEPDRIAIDGADWEVAAVNKVPFPGMPIYIGLAARLVVTS